MKKHAFLIGAYKNPDYLLELIDSLDSERSSFYIHVNKYNDKDFSNFKNKILNRKNIHYYSCFKIKYGGSGFFYSQMLLCNEALKDENNKYFHFLTGQDILCRPLDEFMSFIEEKESNFIKYSEILPIEWNYRYAYYSIFDLLDMRLTRFGRYANSLLIRFQDLINLKRRNLGFSKIFYGSGWWSLRRDTCEYFMSIWNKDKRLQKRVKHTFAPDEMLIHTILLNAENKFPLVNDNLRYIKWNGKTSPQTLSLNDYDDIKMSGKFFARKIDPILSSSLIEKMKK